METMSFSFRKGFEQIPLGKAAEVKTRIMHRLKIRSHGAWLRRLNGSVIPRMNEVEAVESIFMEYGIKEVWGE